MPLNFSQLAAFRAVADAGSVGRGAERLLVSQPAVSKHIRQLERALGIVLFDRTAKGVRPTAAGELLADYARRIFSLADEAEQAVADLRGLRRGRLAIAASPTLGVYFLPELIVQFRRQFPNVTLRLEVENAAVLQRRLLDGEIELAFSEVQPQRRELESRAFMHDQLIAVASPKHVLARRQSAAAARPSRLPAAIARGASAAPPIPLAELCREPFIVRETGSTTKSTVERALAARGIEVEPVMSLGSTEAIKHAVAADLGVAIISRLAATPDLASGRLVQLNVKGLPIRRALYRLSIRGRRLSAAATAFLELLAMRGKSV